MNKKWEIREQDNELTEEIAKKYNLSEITAKILASKNLNDKELEKYLNPTRADFYDPFLMPDMNLAIERIMEAIKNKEKIVVYGDYDADGITSTTILKRFHPFHQFYRFVYFFLLIFLSHLHLDVQIYYFVQLQLVQPTD